MRHLIFLFFLLIAQHGLAQNQNPFGLKVISSVHDYKKSARLDSNNTLIEINKLIPDIQLDIRYASKNNFTGQAVYNQARAFARLPVVNALEKVQQELKISGLGLRIYDAYRPYEVTVKFFKLAVDKNFVANPKDGSRHNRGCAVDLSLIDLKTGTELLMPTPYDSFAPEAASDYQKLPSKAIQNRKLLISVMEKNGFRVLANEWWHFDFIGWQKYDLMDIPFEKL